MKNINLLGDLIAVIETIRGRIENHANSIQQNETRTRQILIDPLLNALGWDVADPNQVTLEYQNKGGRADYALWANKADNRPLAVVEAKTLREPLEDKHVHQALNYANAEGVKYMLTTNGDEWRMYEVFKQAPLEDRLLMEFKVSADPIHQTVLQVLQIWNANLSSKSGPIKAAQPISQTLTATPKASRHAQSPEVAKPTKIGQSVSPVEDGWMTLDDNRLPSKLKARRSGEGFIVQFAGQQEKAKTVAHILSIVVDGLLVRTGKLTKHECPILLGNSQQRYFVHTETVHKNGDQFQGAQQLSNGLYLFTGISTPQMVILLSKLLKRFQVPPSSVKVRTGN